jgi:GNAT superfamily N-acetyltransferase
MLAYLDGQPAGWLGFGPRPALHRLAHSRTIPTVDDLPVWSIVCFLIRPGFRRKGVARAMLRGLIEFARESGAPGLEAYPVDADGARVNTSFGYVGFTSMFEAAGFERVLLTDAHSDRRPRWLMRLMF